MVVDTRHILVPIEFSPVSLGALEMAKGLASDATEITLLHVYDLVRHRTAATLFTRHTAGAFPKVVRFELYERLRQLRERLNGTGKVNLEVIVDTSPARAICDWAEQRSVDLMIVATHGRTGFHRLFSSSVAEQIIRTTPCPALVVRPVTRPQDDTRERETTPNVVEHNSVAMDG
jgi:nucleotide-binding universal stress UspA family protein